MTDSIGIAFHVTSVNSDILKHTSQLSSIDVLNDLVIGDAELKFGESRIAMTNCGLLGLAITLRWLCTFPIQYGMPAFDIAHDDPIQFSTRYVAPELLLTVSEIGSGGAKERHLDPIEFLQSIGTEYRKALIALFQLCPEARQNTKLLALIPDAITLLAARQSWIQAE